MKSFQNQINGIRFVSFLLFIGLVGFTACSSESPTKGEQVAEAPEVNIHEATFFGNTKQIEAHIAAGSDLNEKDQFGSSPLQVAATFGKPAVAKLLIEAGADIDSRSADGSTPLHTAAFFCRTEIVKALLEAGADLTLRNDYQATALESVMAPFEAVKPAYDEVGKALGPMGLKLDYEQLEETRPLIAEMIKSYQQ